jgi:hypothetical protein
MLFHVVADPSEKTDVAGQHPEMVQELSAALQEYSKDLPKKEHRGPGGGGKKRPPAPPS